MLGMSEDSVKSSNKIQKNRSDHVVITKMAEHGWTWLNKLILLEIGDVVWWLALVFFCDFVVGVAWVSLWSEDLLVGECISHDICADEVRFGRFVIWIKWTILLGLLNLHEFARYFVENTSNEYVNVCWLYSNVNSFHWTLGPLDPWGRLAETPRNVWVLVSRVPWVEFPRVSQHILSISPIQ